jgi:hypothetical protein
MSFCAPARPVISEETPAVWLCKAELRRPRMPLRVPSAAGRLRFTPLSSGGNCIPLGGNGTWSRANAWAFTRQLAWHER